MRQQSSVATFNGFDFRIRLRAAHEGVEMNGIQEQESEAMGLFAMRDLHILQDQQVTCWRQEAGHYASLADLDVAVGCFHMLKWRLRDKRSDQLDASAQQAVATCAWLDKLSEGIIQQAIRGGHTYYTREEDVKLEAAAALVKAADLEAATLLAKEMELLRQRYDNELPYNIPKTHSWHVGWAMLAAGWLAADAGQESIPCQHLRLCHFWEAQHARLRYRQTRAVSCPRCDSELEPEDDEGGLGDGPFKAIAAECRSCEVVVYFPHQALPQSIWSSSGVQSKSGLNASSRLETVAPSVEEPRSMPDPAKVFIIHGRNTRAAHEMAHFVRALGLVPIAFDELSAAMGGTPTIADIVTRGMDEAQGVIALFTADERAELRPDFHKPQDKEVEVARWQARPNVIFEAGMAFGRNRDRVVFVCLGSVELFTDVAGIHVLSPSNDPKGHRDTLRCKLMAMKCPANDSSAWMAAGDFEGCVLPHRPVYSSFAETTTVAATAAAESADRLTIADLAKLLDSTWVLNFKENQASNPQFVRDEQLEVLQVYLFEARKPEHEFHDDTLRAKHDRLIAAIEEYLDISSTERVAHDVKQDTYVISTKAAGNLGHIPDYDAKYQRQVDAIRGSVDELWSCWREYARVAKLLKAK